MKRFVFFLITWALAAAVPRYNQTQVSVWPPFLKYQLFHFSELLIEIVFHADKWLIYLLLLQDENQDKDPGTSINSLPLVVVTSNTTISSFHFFKKCLQIGTIYCC